MNKREQRERGRLRKNTVTIISGILIVIVAIVVGLIVNAATMQDRFTNEIVAMNTALDEGNDERINEVLGRKVSSGDYGKVEESLKRYIRDLKDSLDGIDELSEQDELILALNGKYLAQTRDDLGAVRTKLEEASSKAQAYRAKCEKLYSESGAMSYLPDGLDEDYRTLFRENASTFFEDSDTKDSYHDMVALLNGALLMEIDAIKYLDSNKDGWKIENDELVFTNASVEAGYEKIRNNMNKYTTF